MSDVHTGAPDPRGTVKRNPPPIYTIGHSNRSVEAFIDLLRGAGVTQIVDIRSIRRSRANPQYNADTLPASLAAFQISYTFIAALGGRRGRQKDVAADVNGYWRNQSFHNYADYAMSPAFHEGLEDLLALGAQRRCAIMCAEALWWRCHRRIVADYLLLAGRSAIHLMGGRAEAATITPAARPRGNLLVYPAAEAEPDATGD